MAGPIGASPTTQGSRKWPGPICTLTHLVWATAADFVSGVCPAFKPHTGLWPPEAAGGRFCVWANTEKNKG